MVGGMVGDMTHHMTNHMTDTDELYLARLTRSWLDNLVEGHVPLAVSDLHFGRRDANHALHWASVSAAPRPALRDGLGSVLDARRCHEARQPHAVGGQVELVPVGRHPTCRNAEDNWPGTTRSSPGRLAPGALRRYAGSPSRQARNT